MKSTSVRVEFKVTTLFISHKIPNWQRKLYTISIKRPFVGYPGNDRVERPVLDFKIVEVKEKNN